MSCRNMIRACLLMRNTRCYTMEKRTIALFKKILKVVAPPPDVLPSGWAEKNLVLNESALSTGKWRSNTAPYQKEIIDAVIDPEVEKIVIRSEERRVGKEHRYEGPRVH